MNLYFGPEEPVYGARAGSDPRGPELDGSRTMTLHGNKELGVDIRSVGDSYMTLSRRGAIEYAETTPKYYRVPFCNRVKGG